MNYHLRLLIAVYNMWLSYQGAPYRVTGDVVHSRRESNGVAYTLLAFQETDDAPDMRGGAGHVGQPVNNMAGK